MSSTEHFAILACPDRVQICPVPALTVRFSLRPAAGSFRRLAAAFGVVAMLASLGTAQAQNSCSTTPTGTDFSQTGTIAVSGGNFNFGATSSTSASPYPSTITVPSSVSGTVTGIQVRLNGVSGVGGNNGSSLNGIEVLLVSPSGTEMEIMGGEGLTDESVSGLTILIGDHVSSTSFPYMPNGVEGPTSGTACWAPSAYFTTGEFASPVNTSAIHFPQTVGSATLASIFGGQTAAGVWKLYVVDDFGSADSISGWDLFLTVNSVSVGTTTSVASNLQPVYTTSPNNSVTFTASVRGNDSTSPSGGTVAFSANGSTIAGCGAQVVSAGTATCSTSLTTQGLNSIQATYSGSGSYTGSSGTMDELVEAHATQSSNTWCNSGSIVAPDAPSVSAVYPSVISVSGYPSGDTVGEISVELNGITASGGPNDQFLLVAPGGGAHNLDLLDEAFAGTGVSNVNVTVSDSGSSPFDQTATNSTYLPYDGNLNAPNLTGPTSLAPTFDSNIPQVPGTINRPQGLSSVETYSADTLEQAFSGAPVNGDWVLYLYGNSPTTLNGGWCIDFTTINSGAATTTAVSSSQQKATTGQFVAITATVTSSGNPVSSGTVTFVDSTTETTLASGVAVNGSGQATYSSSTFTEGDHKITATYNPSSSSFNTSFGFIWQRLDDATAVAAVNNTTWQYCNVGPVLGEGSGAYTPNPSNIFVTNFPGTLNSVAVDLNSFSIYQETPPYVASLIEAPSGAALDFFSNTGGPGAEQANAGNYIFEDSAGTQVPDAEVNIAAGSYTPTSYQPSYAAKDTFLSSQSGFYNAPSTFNIAPPDNAATFASTFASGSNPNGTWSLFFNQHITASAPSGASNGWCVQLAENPPGVTVLLPDSGTFTAGQPASFTVAITNNGPGSTGDPTGGSAPMKFADTLPNGLTYSNFSGTGWNCSATGQAVTCTNDSSIADGNQYPQLTIDVNVSSSASGALVIGPATASGAGVAATNSNTDNITVIAGTTTTGANASTTFNSASQSVTLAATVTSGAGTVNSGTVTFTVFNSVNTQVGTPAVSGTVSGGSASASYTLPGGSDAGTYTIQASYSGATGFGTSSHNTHTLTVNQAGTTTTASSQSTTFSTSPQNVTLSATVTSAAGTVNSGTVTFTLLNGATPVGSATTSGTVSNGSASVNYSLPGGSTGTLTIQAVYNGSTDFSGGSDNTHSLTINGGSSTTTGANAVATFSSSDQPVLLSATVMSPAGTVNNGTLTFSVMQGATPIGSATAPVNVSNGTAAASYTLPGGTAAGPYTIVASYTGAGGFASSSDNTHTLTVNQAGTSTTAANQSAPFTSTLQTVVLSATVTSGAGSVNAGSVTFTVLNGATPVGTPAISAVSSGNASANYSLPGGTAPGPYTIQAVYSGSIDFTGSNDSSHTLTVQAPIAAQVAVSGYPSPVYAGTAHTGTVMVEDGIGNIASTYSGSATITTSDSSATVTTPVTITNGVGTFTVTFNTTGPQSITATILGLTSVSQTGIQVNSVPGFVVTTATDDATGNAANCPAGGGGADCSLRDALAAAASAGEGNITFDPTDFTAATTINLTGVLTVPAMTSIQGLTTGSGPTVTNLITIDGNGHGGFTVNSGVQGTSIANLIVRNGGGGTTLNEASIVNGGVLALSGSTVTVTNVADGGRGIYNAGTMTLTDSTVSNNLVGPAGNGYGAGIYNTGTLTIVFSSISGNQNGSGNDAFGGGIYSTGTLQIESSTIAGNTASGAAAFGGGIDIAGGSATINNSIVAGNTGGDITGSYSGSGNQSAALSALGNYGGPTQTLLPLPGSAAICGALQANIPNGVTTDQRGEPNTNSTYPGYSTTPCVDAGAVQTNYALSFLTPPPSSGTIPGTAMSPAPAVKITESGALLTAGSASISITDANTDLTTTPATAPATGGVATFSSLIFTSATSGDTLTAALALNPSLTTPLSLTAESTPFSVGMASPVVTWPTASAITYGQTLVSSTLSGGSATFNNVAVPGSFAFTTPTTAPAAGTQSESVTFTPSDTASYATATNTVSVQVNKAPTSISMEPTASSLTYGQTLASSTLSGGTVVSTITNASVPGGFAFTNPAIAPTSTANQSVTFTPSDTNNYLTATGSVSVQVNAASVTVTWPTASAITYGQTLASSTLSGGSATFNNTPVPGSFAFTAPGTAPLAGTQSESVTFTPSNTGEYSPVTSAVNVQVNKAPTSISIEPIPGTLTYGQTLASATLSGGTAISTITNVTVPGGFAFTTPATVPPAGSSSQGVTFTPTDTNNYLAASGSVNVQVNAASVTVTWPTASAITYGQTLASSTLSGGSAKSGNTPVPGTFAFTAPATVPLAGTPTEGVTFTPGNTSQYSPVSSTVSVLVNKAPTHVSVAPSASAITSGQTLTASTLSGGAAVSTITGAVVPGSFAFTNPSAAPATTGPQSVTFTPSDTNDYLATTTSVSVTVNPPAKAPVAKINPTSIDFGTLFLGSIVTKTVTITNTGNASLTINDPRIAIVSGGDSNEFITLNLCPRSLAAGKSCAMTVTFVGGPFYNPQTATLMINGNAAGSPQLVPLTATVINPVAQFSANNLSFGSVQRGKSSAPKTIVVTSVGGTPLSISSVAITGANLGDFSETDTCASTSLKPRAACSITVTFKPTTRGSRYAILRVTDNAWNSPESISLSGTGN